MRSTSFILSYRPQWTYQISSHVGRLMSRIKQCSVSGFSHRQVDDHQRGPVVPAPAGRVGATSNGLLAFIKKAIDLDDAGVDCGLPCLKFHIADHGLIAFSPWMDFPVPPRRRFLLNVKINGAMLHERVPRFAKHTTAVYRLTSSM
jgi:hypothetical protein